MTRRQWLFVALAACIMLLLLAVPAQAGVNGKGKEREGAEEAGAEEAGAEELPGKNPNILWGLGDSDDWGQAWEAKISTDKNRVGKRAITTTDRYGYDPLAPAPKKCSSSSMRGSSSSMREVSTPQAACGPHNYKPTKRGRNYQESAARGRNYQESAARGRRNDKAPARRERNDIPEYDPESGDESDDSVLETICKNMVLHLLGFHEGDNIRGFTRKEWMTAITSGMLGKKLCKNVQKYRSQLIQDNGSPTMDVMDTSSKVHKVVAAAAVFIMTEISLSEGNEGGAESLQHPQSDPKPGTRHKKIARFSYPEDGAHLTADDDGARLTANDDDAHLTSDNDEEMSEDMGDDFSANTLPLPLYKSALRFLPTEISNERFKVCFTGGATIYRELGNLISCVLPLRYYLKNHNEEPVSTAMKAYIKNGCHGNEHLPVIFDYLKVGRDNCIGMGQSFSVTSMVKWCKDPVAAYDRTIFPSELYPAPEKCSRFALKALAGIKSKREMKSNDEDSQGILTKPSFSDAVESLHNLATEKNTATMYDHSYYRCGFPAHMTVMDHKEDSEVTKTFLKMCKTLNGKAIFKHEPTSGLSLKGIGFRPGKEPGILVIQITGWLKTKNGEMLIPQVPGDLLHIYSFDSWFGNRAVGGITLNVNEKEKETPYFCTSSHSTSMPLTEYGKIDYKGMQEPVQNKKGEVIVASNSRSDVFKAVAKVTGKYNPELFMGFPITGKSDKGEVKLQLLLTSQNEVEVYDQEGSKDHLAMELRFEWVFTAVPEYMHTSKLEAFTKEIEGLPNVCVMYDQLESGEYGTEAGEVPARSYLESVRKILSVLTRYAFKYPTPDHELMRKYSFLITDPSFEKVCEADKKNKILNRDHVAVIITYMVDETTLLENTLENLVEDEGNEDTLCQLFHISCRSPLAVFPDEQNGAENAAIRKVQGYSTNNNIALVINPGTMLCTSDNERVMSVMSATFVKNAKDACHRIMYDCFVLKSNLDCETPNTKVKMNTAELSAFQLCEDDKLVMQRAFTGLPVHQSGSEQLCMYDGSTMTDKVDKALKMHEALITAGRCFWSAGVKEDLDEWDQEGNRLQCTLKGSKSRRYCKTGELVDNYLIEKCGPKKGGLAADCAKLKKPIVWTSAYYGLVTEYPDKNCLFSGMAARRNRCASNMELMTKLHIHDGGIECEVPSEGPFTTLNGVCRFDGKHDICHVDCEKDPVLYVWGCSEGPQAGVGTLQFAVSATVLNFANLLAVSEGFKAGVDYLKSHSVILGDRICGEDARSAYGALTADDSISTKHGMIAGMTLSRVYNIIPDTEDFKQADVCAEFIAKASKCTRDVFETSSPRDDNDIRDELGLPVDGGRGTHETAKHHLTKHLIDFMKINFHKTLDGLYTFLETSKDGANVNPKLLLEHLEQKGADSAFNYLLRSEIHLKNGDGEDKMSLEGRESIFTAIRNLMCKHTMRKNVEVLLMEGALNEYIDKGDKDGNEKIKKLFKDISSIKDYKERIKKLDNLTKELIRNVILIHAVETCQIFDGMSRNCMVRKMNDVTPIDTELARFSTRKIEVLNHALRLIERCNFVARMHEEADDREFAIKQCLEEDSFFGVGSVDTRPQWLATAKDLQAIAVQYISGNLVRELPKVYSDEFKHIVQKLSKLKEDFENEKIKMPEAEDLHELFANVNKFIMHRHCRKKQDRFGTQIQSDIMNFMKNMAGWSGESRPRREKWSIETITDEFTWTETFVEHVLSASFLASSKLNVDSTAKFEEFLNAVIETQSDQTGPHDTRFLLKVVKVDGIEKLVMNETKVIQFIEAWIKTGLTLRIGMQDGNENSGMVRSALVLTFSDLTTKMWEPFVKNHPDKDNLPNLLGGDATNGVKTNPVEELTIADFIDDFTPAANHKTNLESNFKTLVKAISKTPQRFVRTFPDLHPANVEEHGGCYVIHDKHEIDKERKSGFEIDPRNPKHRGLFLHWCTKIMNAKRKVNYMYAKHDKNVARAIGAILAQFEDGSLVIDQDTVEEARPPRTSHTSRIGWMPPLAHARGRLSEIDDTLRRNTDNIISTIRIRGEQFGSAQDASQAAAEAAAQATAQADAQPGEGSSLNATPLVLVSGTANPERFLHDSRIASAVQDARIASRDDQRERPSTAQVLIAGQVPPTPTDPPAPPPGEGPTISQNVEVEGAEGVGTCGAAIPEGGAAIPEGGAAIPEGGAAINQDLTTISAASPDSAWDQFVGGDHNENDILSELSMLDAGGIAGTRTDTGGVGGNGAGVPSSSSSSNSSNSSSSSDHEAERTQGQGINEKKVPERVPGACFGLMPGNAEVGAGEDPSAAGPQQHIRNNESVDALSLCPQYDVQASAAGISSQHQQPASAASSQHQQPASAVSSQHQQPESDVPESDQVLPITQALFMVGAAAAGLGAHEALRNRSASTNSGGDEMHVDHDAAQAAQAAGAAAAGGGIEAAAAGGGIEAAAAGGGNKAGAAGGGNKAGAAGGGNKAGAAGGGNEAGVAGGGIKASGRERRMTEKGAALKKAKIPRKKGSPPVHTVD